LEQCRAQDIAGFTPVETGMRNNDFHTRDEQAQEANGRDPVRPANYRRMAHARLRFGNGG